VKPQVGYEFARESGQKRGGVNDIWPAVEWLTRLARASQSDGDLDMANEIDIAALAAEIRQTGASWTAEENYLTQASEQERERRLGYVPGPGEPSLEERVRVARTNYEALRAGEGLRAVGAPAAYDLRNVGGKSYITSVKDQGGCGSCVAFGTSATVEGAARRLRNNPDLAIDLSEAHLFYCQARSQGRNCGNGWWVPPALDCFKNTGVADDTCYPYTAGDQNCTNLCSDWQNRVTKITAWHSITSAAAMKDWISTKGPLGTCFTVYQDFFAYRSGVYRHVSGGVAGGHCVCCVGYDDGQSCWICKNSWGSAWGDAGYFRIAYGECGIDATMWAVDGIVDSGWLNNVRVIGLWAIDQDRNAWVYLRDSQGQNLGWKRISWDNDNIFFDMLVQLAAAKGAARPVNIRIDNGVVREIYVF
jgi:C1A family cysteine protease